MPKRPIAHNWLIAIKFLPFVTLVAKLQTSLGSRGSPDVTSRDVLAKLLASCLPALPRRHLRDLRRPKNHRPQKYSLASSPVRSYHGFSKHQFGFRRLSIRLSVMVLSSTDFHKVSHSATQPCPPPPFFRSKLMQGSDTSVILTRRYMRRILPFDWFSGRVMQRILPHFSSTCFIL